MFPRATWKIGWVKAEIVFSWGGDPDDITTPAPSLNVLQYTLQTIKYTF